MSRADLDAERVKFEANFRQRHGILEYVALRGELNEWKAWKAALASQAPAASQVPRCLLAPLPDWTKHDDLGGLVPGEVRQAMHDYARASWEISVTTQAPAVQQEQAVISLLIDVARCAYSAMDETEENNTGLHWNKDSFSALSEAVDKLDALPDDRPGYVMGPAAKAEWALRAPSPQGDAEDWLSKLTRFGWSEAYIGDTSELIEDQKGTYVKFADVAAIDAARKESKP